MSKFRRFFSVVLAASMVMGSVPSSISADDMSYDLYENSGEEYAESQGEDERGISREGEEEEKGIIHYCAVDGREHDYCVTAKSETKLIGRCKAYIGHPIGSDDVIVDTDFKGERKGTFYCYCDERD